MKNKKRKMVNIRLDEVLWRDAKIQAIKEGKTLQVFVEGVLRDRIQET